MFAFCRTYGTNLTYLDTGNMKLQFVCSANVGHIDQCYNSTQVSNLFDKIDGVIHFLAKVSAIICINAMHLATEVLG